MLCISLYLSFMYPNSLLTVFFCNSHLSKYIVNYFKYNHLPEDEWTTLKIPVNITSWYEFLILKEIKNSPWRVSFPLLAAGICPFTL